MNKKIVFLRICSVVLLLLWMGLIFYFSSQTGEQSSQTSSSITQDVVEIVVPNYDNMDATEQTKIFDGFHFTIRKLAHFTEYFVLGMLAFIAIMSYKIKFGFKGLIALVFSFLYACSDEYHQSFVASRGPQFKDVMIDTSGALLSITILMLIVFLVQRKKQSKIA